MDFGLIERKEAGFKQVVAKITESRKIINELSLTGGGITIFKASTNYETIPLRLSQPVSDDKTFGYFIENAYSYFFECVQSSEIYTGDLKKLPAFRAYFKHNLETQDQNYEKKVTTVLGYFEELSGRKFPGDEDWIKMQERILLSANKNLDELKNSMVTKDEKELIKKAAEINKPVNLKEYSSEKKEIMDKLLVDMDLNCLQEDVFSFEDFEYLFSKMTSLQRNGFNEKLFALFFMETSYFRYNLKHFVALLSQQEIEHIATAIYQKVMLFGATGVELLCDVDYENKIKNTFVKSQFNDILIKSFKDKSASWNTQTQVMVLANYYSKDILESPVLLEKCFEYIRYVRGDTGHYARIEANNFVSVNFPKLSENLRSKCIELLNS
ncbi:MAG: hypothetical protein WC821_01105 [archaeon]|jgi:hypothetical protein